MWLWTCSFTFLNLNFWQIFKKNPHGVRFYLPHKTQYWKFCKHQHCITNENWWFQTISIPTCNILEKNKICIKFSFQFCDIENLENVLKKLAKVVEFTLEQKKFQCFPKILSKKRGILFGKRHWKFAWVEKKNNTWIHKEINLQKKSFGSKLFVLVWTLTRDQFLGLTRIKIFNFQVM